jgi:hypothetical protein
MIGLSGALCRHVELSVGRRLVSLLALVGVITCVSRLDGQTPSETSGPNDSAEASDPLRHLLGLLGVDRSQLNYVQDGTELSADDMEPLARLLYVLPRLGRAERAAWSRTATDWALFEQQPAEKRLEMVSLDGRVLQIERIDIAPEAAQRFGYDHFYQLEVVAAPGERHIKLCTRRIPQPWNRHPQQVPTDGFPIRADAVFFKRAESFNGVDRLLFVTDRIAWHPQQPDPAWGVSAGAALLGSQGMDISLLDDLVQGQPLLQEDREAFYQMLWAARRIPPTAIASQAKPVHDDLAQLITEPSTKAGDAYHLRGLARRAVLVRVPDADIQQRWGIDHYFEVELFLPLDQRITLRDPQTGKELTYQNFPLTLCIAALPTGMPQGDEIRQLIRLDAFFLKLRSYRSRFVDDADDADQQHVSRRQLSPLFIAPTVTLDSIALPQDHWPAWTLMAIVLGGTLVAVLARGWYRRADRRFERWRRQSGGDAPDWDRMP